MKRKGRGGSRLRGALVASALLHVAAIGVLWALASRGAELPQLKVYAVNLVSPPPREQGETAPERVPPAAEPTPEAPAEPPAPAPQPTPQPPAAQPARTPPQPAPARQPPAPQQPRQPPAQQTPPRQPPAQQQPPRQPPRQPAQQQPREQPAQQTPPRQTPPAQQTPPRQGEAAPRPAPSTGAAPSRTSPGGENLAVRTEGAVCPSEAYCNNIAAQVQRYFRRPPDSYSDRGDVCFRIARDGSVSDMEVQRLRGSFAFRLALLEAVEQAGRREAFGPLPSAFRSDALPVCVGVTPQV